MIYELCGSQESNWVDWGSGKWGSNCNSPITTIIKLGGNLSNLPMSLFSHM